MKTKTILVMAVMAALLVPAMSLADPAEAPTYLPGFTWDWQTDFGEPHAVSELPPNPNSDSSSRGLDENAGLSSGPQATSVWQYGNALYSSFQNGTFTSSDFVIFTQAGTRDVSGYAEYFWSDSLIITGNWDQVVFGPNNPLHPGHYVCPDSCSGQEAVVLRWTYSGNGSVPLRIRGIVKDCAPGYDGVDFYLLKNSYADTLAYAVIADEGDYAVDAATTVEPGDELFLVVGYLANDGSDIVYVDVTIAVTPEPATLSLLALGGLAMMRRRRK
jgi:hypothetical protein